MTENTDVKNVENVVVEEKPPVEFFIYRKVSENETERAAKNIFNIKLTVKGKLAEDLEYANNPVLTSCVFSQYAIQAQQKIRKQWEDETDWNQAGIQKFADGLEPTMGKGQNIEKRILSAVANATQYADQMTSEERQGIMAEMQRAEDANKAKMENVVETENVDSLEIEETTDTVKAEKENKKK